MRACLTDEVAAQYVIQYCFEELAVNSDKISYYVCLFPVIGKFAHFLFYFVELYDHCLRVGVNYDVGNAAYLKVGQLQTFLTIVLTHYH